MIEKYASNKEYASLFITLTREQVVDNITIGKKVLDIAAGSAYFSLLLAKRNPDSHITIVDIFDGSIKQAMKNIEKARLTDRINAIQMDASELDFTENEFDTVVNYLGLEDIHMTRGITGVKKTFQEVYKVLKQGGSFYFVVMPRDQMDTIPQKLEADVFSWICGATWLDTDKYIEFTREAGFIFKHMQSYFTGKKLTVKQAKEEIEYACHNVPINYGVKTKSFQETWEKFGSLFQEHGMGHYSKTVLFEVEK